ncbi:MAG: ABC transporter permease [Firmicutes bacterium]|nr:ABC transporter permease [Bacillota bacterium]
MQNYNKQIEKQSQTGLMYIVKSYLKTQAIPLIVLFLMVIISSFLSPVFLSMANAQNLVVQIALSMVVSMGMFIVILTGGIDLSVGSLVALSGVLAAGFMRTMSVWWALLFTIAICTFLGAFTGLIVAKLKIAPFIVTLGMLSFVSGLSYWYTQSSPISWRTLEGAYVINFIGSSKIFGIPVLAVIWVVMILITAFIMRRTIIGRIMYGIGGNETAVKLSGIDISKWKIFPYAFSGFCCGLGGILLMSRLGVGSPTSGTGLELDCIAAVVIGGTSFSGGIGNVSGVVIGVFILGIINNILDLLNVPSYPQLMLKGAIIVLAVILSTIRERRQ